MPAKKLKMKINNANVFLELRRLNIKSLPVKLHLPVKHMFKSLYDDYLDGETLDCVWIFLMVAVVPPQLRGEHAELSEGDVIV